MGKYWAGKRIEAVFTLLVLALLVFIASRVSGDPIALLAPSEAHGTALERQVLEERLGLDGDIFQQFGSFILDLVQGDLGRSYSYRAPVWNLFMERFPNTLKLIIPAFFFAILVSIPLGVVSARRRGKLIDRAAGVGAVAGVSIPNPGSASCSSWCSPCS